MTAGSVVGTWGAHGSALAPVDQNTLVRGSLADAWWTLMAPASAPKTQIADESDSGYADGVLVNPFADAPAGAFLGCFVTPPPGATGLTLTARLKTATTLSNPPATVVLAIYDATGTTKLASTVCSLTATATAYAVTYSSAAPGTEYQVRVLVNDTGNGTTSQAQFECLSVSVTAPGATGVFSGPYVRMHVTPGGYQDNILPPSTASDHGYRPNEFASFVVETNAPYLVVAFWSPMWAITTGLKNDTSLGVRVNGRETPAITPSSGLLQYATIALPAGGGTHTVEITTGITYAPENAQYGTFLCALYVQTSATIKHVPQALGAGRSLIVLADSIVGSQGNPAVTRSLIAQLRQYYPGRVVAEAYGARQLNDNAASVAALVTKIASGRPTDVLVELGTNDWANASMTATSFATLYAAFLDALHAALPAATVWCQTPGIRNGEPVTNANSEFLRDFREAIAVACSTRSFTRLVPGAALYLVGDTVDGLHPGALGSGRYGRQLLTVMSLLPGTPSFSSAVQASQLSSVTPYAFWRTAGLAAGSLGAWTDIVNGYQLLQNTGGLQPTVVAGVQNGLPSVRFTTSQWMQQPASPVHALTHPFSVVMATKPSAITAPSGNDCLLDGLSGNFTAFVATDNTPITYIYGTPIISSHPAFSLSTTQWSIIVGVWNAGGTCRIDVFTFGNSAPTTKTFSGSMSSTTSPNGFTLNATGSSRTRGIGQDVLWLDTFAGAMSAADENTWVEGVVKAALGL